MAGNCETITNSASAKARVEAWAELGNNLKNIVNLLLQRELIVYSILFRYVANFAIFSFKTFMF